MITKFYKSEKFQAVFFPVLYFLLAAALVVTGCFIFKKKYYQPVIVDGTSMLPTLSGGRSFDEYKTFQDKEGNPVNVAVSYRYNYGTADLHRHSVNNIKRFDVVVTHYPKTWGTEDGIYIIKRVWGFPGETISLTYDSTEKAYTFTAEAKGKKYEIKAPVVSYTKSFETECIFENKRYIYNEEKTFTAAKFVLKNKTFYTNVITQRTFSNHKLGKNEYFVMGDNWDKSTDSYSNIGNSHKLNKPYILGRVLYIYAYASLVNDNPTAFHEFDKRYNF